MPDPTLQVSLLTPSEAEQYMLVRHETFRNTVNKILYPRGEPSQKTLDRVTSEIRDGITNKGILFLKCVDTTTNTIVAGARWRYVKPTNPDAKQRTWAEVDAGLVNHLDPYDESDPALLTALYDLFNVHQRKVLETQPHYILDTLVTLPQHERRGAGSMLVGWGCAKADEAGVVAYLEASLIAAPMYARHGFEAVGELELDLRKFGGDEEMRFIAMLRPAKKVDGV
ncbi:acyl-CoA N-acyltransferase [Ophiobolus disseminans]|uniref:Acyl-CoA N-acyltransferase n=1 Tax=Ophiobolus disseminans TaxID=1469910 RepID=A0A6A6ZQB5_9PLEO|nr:acyl-CoA N-acyltransferase [Ophiobolus disseminans]